MNTQRNQSKVYPIQLFISLDTLMDTPNWLACNRPRSRGIFSLEQFARKVDLAILFSGENLMIGALKLSLATMVALGVVTSQAAAQCEPPKKLSGMYEASDGGTYFLRRVGDAVWWMGRSSDDGRSWTNVFRGTLNGDTFEGEWSDVIHGNGDGRLTLRMIGSIDTGVAGFDRIGGSGDGFGGEHWRRPCNDTN